MKFLNFFKTPTTESVMTLFTQAVDALDSVAELHLAKADRLNQQANEARAAAVSAANEAARADAMAVRLNKILEA